MSASGNTKTLAGTEGLSHGHIVLNPSNLIQDLYEPKLYLNHHVQCLSTDIFQDYI